MRLSREHILSRRKEWLFLLILLIFATFYACISLVNHYHFRTFAYDLSYYNQALYNFSKFRLGTHDLYYANYTHIFGDHFEPMLILISPLRYIFGTMTLLFVQIGGVLFGAWGLYRYVKRRSDLTWLPHIAAIYFLSFWGCFSAFGFDFHTSVLGAMLVPWLVNAFEQEKWRQTALWFVLFLMCGEKVAFWGLFLGLGLAVLHWKEKRKRWIALGGAGFSLVYFVLVMKLVIPAFIRPGKEYRHLRFHALGENVGEILGTIFTRPFYTLSLLWKNHVPDQPEMGALKFELHKMVLLSGGLILLRRPAFLLMLLPIYATKLFNDIPAYWGINMHYSIEFVPIISIALLGWIMTRRQVRWQYGLAIGAAVLTLGSTFISFSTRYKLHYTKPNYDLFSSDHWRRWEYDTEKVREAIALVPDGVAVAASDPLTPHLSMRDKLYMFPKVHDAEYAVILLKADTYPRSVEETHRLKSEMQESGNWETVSENDDVVVLKRLGNPD